MFSGPSCRLFTVFGLPISAHWTLFLALGMMGIANDGLVGVWMGVLLFMSILAHELGHAWIALRRRVAMDGIDLHLFGGVAKMREPPRSPKDEIAIAIAGPLVSIGLALGGFALGSIFFHGALPTWLSWICGANLILGIFNLIPALPMDGGRVLRAYFARKMGLVNGTKAAVKVSRFAAISFAVIGIIYNPWLIALSIFVWVLGSAELRQMRIHQRLNDLGYRNADFDPWARYNRACSTNSEQQTPDVLPPENASERFPKTPHPADILQNLTGEASHHEGRRAYSREVYRIIRDEHGQASVVRHPSYRW